MSASVTGTFGPGDHTLIKAAHSGDFIALKNEGPGTIYVTSSSLGKDHKILPGAFVAWVTSAGEEKTSINVQIEPAVVTLTRAPGLRDLD